jgi:hypothetical protein
LPVTPSISGRPAGRHLGRHLHAHVGDAGHAAHRVLGSGLHLVLDRARRRRQLDRERDVAVADAQVFDEVQRDDVAAEVRIAHRSQRVEDAGLGDVAVGGCHECSCGQRG